MSFGRARVCVCVYAVSVVTHVCLFACLPWPVGVQSVFTLMVALDMVLRCGLCRTAMSENAIEGFCLFLMSLLLSVSVSCM